MTPWRQGDAYLSRSDNPPELSEAMSLWGFPADFDPTQLPTGMFMCVMDEFTKVRIAKGLQKPSPPQPPPMRIGQEGDTIDGAGVRRKADGSLRNFTMDAIRWWGVCAWMGMMVLAVVSYVTGHQQ